MTSGDLDDMARLLGDPLVMEFYPAPKTRDEAARWIAWNEENYAADGFGLWVVETREGDFVGDCGLTWQDVNGEPKLEVGYHVRSELHGQGLATEAAAACRDLAREHGIADELVAIIHPDNTASERVARKIGMTRLDDDHGGDIAVRTVLGMRLDRASAGPLGRLDSTP
jgi:RimJ/RimL family protein N-acetyltransferase